MLDDLGDRTIEVLTARDPAFVVSEGSYGRAIFAPEWVDLLLRLGVTPGLPPVPGPRLRAKTKGKVERAIREIKQGFAPGLNGQGMSPRPSLADYDWLAASWVAEVVLPRHHRTTERA